MASQDDKPEGPWDKETKRKFETKSRSEYFDPCQEAAARSIRCLNRNGGDRKMCTDYFEAYRACKKEWVSWKEALLDLENWRANSTDSSRSEGKSEESRDISSSLAAQMAI
ncbi:hypothetical protein BX600DRAFT_167673 [Xylariales sp. PMI_506]|nr:hypothetical protein BX600DRAFT_167673 [Xylariales sp. PMI_506]